jgi:hypothetical protein
MATTTNTPTAQKWSVRMTDSVMKRQPILPTGDYENGLMLRATEQVWLKTDDPKFKGVGPFILASVEME